MIKQKTVTPRFVLDAVSDAVAEAAMTLPPLTREQDTEFLRRATAMTVEALWHNYQVTMGEAAFEEHEAAVAQDDPAAFVAWMNRYADFANNPQHLEIALRLVGDMRELLPGILQDAYPSFAQ